MLLTFLKDPLGSFAVHTLWIFPCLIHRPAAHFAHTPHSIDGEIQENPFLRSYPLILIPTWPRDHL